MIHTITGSSTSIEILKNKKASFLLALSNTDTANIQGISQAGIPNQLHLTPTLDAEFLCTGKVLSLDNIAKTPKGVPTPALMTRAVHLLCPYGKIAVLNLGLKILPKVDKNILYHFDIQPSQSIDKGANIDAKSIFEKGLNFGKNYICKDDYVILGESVPSGTTTATATALALGYDAKDLFSSSFKNVPHNIKEETIKKALENIQDSDSLFEKISKVSDNMLIFNAGFVLGINSRFPLILAGGTQMASVLLLTQSISKDLNLLWNTSKVFLCTTKWVAKDKHSNIKALLQMLDTPINAYYSDFDFSLSTHPALKRYEEGEAKEGVGAGGALVYASLNGLDFEDIREEVEAFL
ncbi:Nicotinate-nucleotide--dimethylbenzimidazole phosphoribosyltransferase [hydrothermal vent metagenome]|uniref:Nicotinate-nucleotide--dimethylbenzimidazole phosphoribosyltransferase n=1 Tax=hydrothermal vent metagenome TaxID=652676 RepID=A0A1W1D0P8_9ZZZZ